jgi:hypothetical protein
MLAFHGSNGAGGQIGHFIAKEVLWPVLDISL